MDYSELERKRFKTFYPLKNRSFFEIFKISFTIRRGFFTFENLRSLALRRRAFGIAYFMRVVPALDLPPCAKNILSHGASRTKQRFQSFISLFLNKYIPPPGHYLA